MTKLHLAYLTSQYPAASHTFIRREVEAIRELGHDVDTYSVRQPSPAEAGNGRDRAEAERTYYLLKQPAFSFATAHLAMFFSRPARYLKTLGFALGHRAPGVRGLFLAMAHFAESVLLARELWRTETTHLHNHFANSAATVGLLATRMLGIGWSFTMHGISETDYPAGLMLGRKIEAADMVACVSWFGRAQGMRLVGPAHWFKMHVVRCGLPFDRLPPRGPRSGEVDTIICVGRLSPEKGQSGLLQVFANLSAQYPRLRLQLVGDGPDRAMLEATSTKLRLNDKVSFLGRLSEDETLAAIGQSDLLALPSLMEGLPIVLMEAMALGVPVVASRVAGIPELVEDGTSGLLFAPSDWPDLERQVERLLVDSKLYGAVAEQGRRKVSTEFDTRKSAAELAELFRATQHAVVQSA